MDFRERRAREIQEDVRQISHESRKINVDTINCKHCGSLVPSQSYKCNHCGEKITEFSEHPSTKLKECYMSKPYQGVDPTKASIIFFGRDANYARDVATNQIFINILFEYHADGEYFWAHSTTNPNRYHHPFLLDIYHYRENNAGYKYHKVFSDIGMDHSYARYVSFIETLNVPTTGDPNNDPRKEFNRLFAMSQKHMLDIEDKLLFHGNKLVFIPSNAMQYLHKVRGRTDLYKKLYRKKDFDAGKLEVVYQRKNVYFVKYYHLSDRRAPKQLPRIKALIDSFLKSGTI